jgi:hypothetical protein
MRRDRTFRNGADTGTPATVRHSYRKARHHRLPRNPQNLEDTVMCMNCGCGEPEKRHQPTDITSDDLQRAADGSGITLDEATANLRSSLDKIDQTKESQPAV